MNYENCNINTETFKIQNNDKGRGIYANKFLKKDTIIQACPIVVFKLNKNQSLPQEIDNIIFSDNKKNHYIICLGIGSLFNHSDQNNIMYFINRKEKLMYFYAAKDIEKDQELFINYGPSWFSDRGYEKL